MTNSPPSWATWSRIGRNVSNPGRRCLGQGPPSGLRFHNDLPGHGRPGVIFIGANDDGSPASICISDRLLLTLADIKSDGKIVPPPTMTITHAGR